MSIVLVNKFQRLNNEAFPSRVGEVSLRSECFQSGCIYATVLAFISMVLDAEFFTETNGVIHGRGSPTKKYFLLKNTVLCRKF